MAEYMFVEVNENLNQDESISNLILKLKCASINLATLHRNIKGGDGEWMTVHQKLADYYFRMIDFEDKVIECLMSLGYKDQTINTCDYFIESKDFDLHTALTTAKDILKDLYDNVVSLRENIEFPDSANSTFDAFEEWLNIESNYILERSLI